MIPRPFAFLAVAACTIGVLLGLELFLRVAGYQARDPYGPDPVLGWTRRPALDVNAAGVRDRRTLIHKAEDVYRIAVLGDGYTEAMDLPVNQTYWRLLPKHLEECGFQPGRRVEVLNFAVAGYSTAQAYVMLETRAIRYAPDLVLLQFAADDVRENSFALADRKDRPFFMLEPGGGLRFDDAFATAPDFRRETAFSTEVLRRLADRSRLLQLVSRAQAGSQQALRPHEALWEEAWRITEGVMRKAAAFSARNGARFMVLSIPPQRRIAELGLHTVHLPSGTPHAAAAELIAKALCP
jgi:hypothetical protein